MTSIQFTKLHVSLSWPAEHGPCVSAQLSQAKDPSGTAVFFLRRPWHAANVKLYGPEVRNDLETMLKKLNHLCDRKWVDTNCPLKIILCILMHIVYNSVFLPLWRIPLDSAPHHFIQASLHLPGPDHILGTIWTTSFSAAGSAPSAWKLMALSCCNPHFCCHVSLVSLYYHPGRSGFLTENFLASSLKRSPCSATLGFAPTDHKQHSEKTYSTKYQQSNPSSSLTTNTFNNIMLSKHIR